MQVSQVYSIINTAIADAGQNVTVKDTSSIVSFGKTLIVDEHVRDNFFRKLIDRIGRTVIEERRYLGDMYNLRKEPFEYGAILQKIYVEPMPAKINNSWDLQNGDIVQIGEVYKANVTVTLWNQVDTWEVDITIVEEQIKSAFLNAESLGAFIASLFTKVEDSLAMQYEKLEELVFCTMIGNALHATDDEGHNYLKINLAKIADLGEDLMTDTGGGVLTKINDALRSKEALLLMLKYINKYSLLMRKMTTVFNSMNFNRFTPKDRQRLAIHTDLMTGFNTILKAYAYNDDALEIPDENVTVVPYWQSFANEGEGSTGEPFVTINEDKAIKISHNWNGSGVSSVENDCVLAVLYDEEAIATTIQNRRIKSDVIGKGEFTNYYYKAEIGYLIDPSENCIVFTWNP